MGRRSQFALRFHANGASGVTSDHVRAKHFRIRHAPFGDRFATALPTKREPRLSRAGGRDTYHHSRPTVKLGAGRCHLLALAWACLVVSENIAAADRSGWIEAKHPLAVVAPGFSLHQDMCETEFVAHSPCSRFPRFEGPGVASPAPMAALKWNIHDTPMPPLWVDPLEQLCRSIRAPQSVVHRWKRR